LTKWKEVRKTPVSDTANAVPVFTDEIPLRTWQYANPAKPNNEIENIFKANQSRFELSNRYVLPITPNDYEKLLYLNINK
jgi:hypothetical protein